MGLVDPPCGYPCPISPTVAPELLDDSQSHAEGLDLLKKWDTEFVPGSLPACRCSACRVVDVDDVAEPGFSLCRVVDVDFAELSM